MLDKMGDMLSNPQAQEMMFQVMAQQMAQLPLERRQALGRVEVVVTRQARGLNMYIGDSDDPQVASVIDKSVSAWSGFLARAFQAMGFQVKLYD